MSTLPPSSKTIRLPSIRELTAGTLPDTLNQISFQAHKEERVLPGITSAITSCGHSPNYRLERDHLINTQQESAQVPLKTKERNDLIPPYSCSVGPIKLEAPKLYPQVPTLGGGSHFPTEYSQYYCQYPNIPHPAPQFSHLPIFLLETRTPYIEPGLCTDPFTFNQSRGLSNQDQLAKPSKPVNMCHRCGTTETPEWRRGPKGARTLCNACGLYHTKLVKKKGAALAAEEVLKNKVFKGKNGRRVSIKKYFLNKLKNSEKIGIENHPQPFPLLPPREPATNVPQHPFVAIKNQASGLPLPPPVNCIPGAPSPYPTTICYPGPTGASVIHQ